MYSSRWVGRNGVGTAPKPLKMAWGTAREHVWYHDCLALRREGRELCDRPMVKNIAQKIAHISSAFPFNFPHHLHVFCFNDNSEPTGGQGRQNRNHFFKTNRDVQDDAPVGCSGQPCPARPKASADACGPTTTAQARLIRNRSWAILHQP